MTGEKQSDSDPAAPDVPLVAQAAALIEVSEYRLFALAHVWWTGKTPPDGLLEGAFGAYLHAGRAPAWVRHYARSLLAADLDAPGAKRRLCLNRLPPPSPAPRGARWAAIVAVTCAAAVALAIVATYPPYSSMPEARVGSPPPTACAEAPGLRALDRFARAFAERKMPACPEP
jgi:hypothetical protein